MMRAVRCCGDFGSLTSWLTNAHPAEGTVMSTTQTRASDARSSAQQPLQARYGPWALIAGASDGVGAEFARQVAAAGINCILVARRLQLLDQLAGELKTQHAVQ